MREWKKIEEMETWAEINKYKPVTNSQVKRLEALRQKFIDKGICCLDKLLNSKEARDLLEDVSIPIKVTIDSGGHKIELALTTGGLKEKPDCSIHSATNPGQPCKYREREDWIIGTSHLRKIVEKYEIDEYDVIRVIRILTA